MFSFAEAVEYKSLCGYIAEASKNCDHLTGECAGEMKLSNVCQYSFFKIYVPVGTKYLKISFKNKNIYSRLSCREVKVVVRMDNNYLDEKNANVKSVVFYDDLKTQNSYLLKDLSKVYVSIRDINDESLSPLGKKKDENPAKSHYLYVGTLSHVDEMSISFVILEKYISTAGCAGEMKANMDIGCTGESECGGALSSYDENSPFVSMRKFFWSRIKMECMPGNLSGCKEKDECEEAGGYWVNSQCLEGIPFSSYSYVCGVGCIGDRDKAYFCVDSDSYDISQKVDFYLHVPKFDRKVDVYLGMLKPNGELEVIYKSGNELKRKLVRKVDDIVPFKTELSEEYSWSFSQNISLVSFSGDYIRIMESGEYTLYLLIVPSDKGLASNDYILQECKFSIE